MRGFVYSCIIGGSLSAGFLFYGWYNDYIIIRLPIKRDVPICEKPFIERKNAKFYYWQNDKWAFEEKMILASSDPLCLLSELITHWLATLEQEMPFIKRVTLDQLLIDRSGIEAFISLDKFPFPPTYSTLQKLLWVEGLLKTLKEARVPIAKVNFLVKSKPLADSDLDFSRPYPLSGYLSFSS